MSPTFRPGDESGPTAMVERARAERRQEERERRAQRALDRNAHPEQADASDPIKPGWPGPMDRWTTQQHNVFAQAFAFYLGRGYPESRAWAHAYGEVTRMPEGRLYQGRRT